MTNDPTVMPGPIAPVRFDVEYADSHSRLLIFVKWLLAIPHYIVLYLLGIVASIFTIIAFFSILFTKKYPKGMFDFVVGVRRWTGNQNAYLFLLRDEYPPFSWEPGKYPVTLEIDHQEEYARFAPLYKWLLSIPNIIVYLLVAIVAILLLFIGWFAILFTGRLPRGIHDFLVGTHRWGERLNAYVYLLRDDYPPFSMK